MKLILSRQLNNSHTIKILRKIYSHAKPHQVDLYQELSEEYNDVVLISNAKWMDNHTQSLHLDEEVYQKGLQLDWMIGPQGPQTGILSPEKKKNWKKAQTSATLGKTTTPIQYLPDSVLQNSDLP